jgi:hypothetical protein
LENKDGSIVVVLFNPTANSKSININLKDKKLQTNLNGEAIQTVLIK